VGKKSVGKNENLEHIPALGKNTLGKETIGGKGHWEKRIGKNVRKPVRSAFSPPGLVKRKVENESR